MEVISWLGVWYVKGELYEDAIQFFERAAEIEPNEVKWQLMVARYIIYYYVVDPPHCYYKAIFSLQSMNDNSCYRRMGSYTQALTLYKKIHRQYPENLECKRYHRPPLIPRVFSPQTHHHSLLFAYGNDDDNRSTISM
jgi:intraflagellar transport protein 88